MKRELTPSLLDELTARAARKKNIHGAVICVEKGDDTLSLTSGAGNLRVDDLYFIASVTKLFITAVLLKLRADQLLRLDDPISRYLPTELIRGIHVWKGKDYSGEITVKQLMSNTSGIPDYFQGDVVSKLLRGEDLPWSLEKSLDTARQLKPKFIPGQQGKAHYSDTNYQLLGRLIETITGKSIRAVFQQFIFDELKLAETYVFTDVKDTRPVPIYYKARPLHLPHYMASIAPDGGIVSTARDMMTFLRAFFNGRLFPREDLKELMSWNLLWGPGLFFYGVGLSRQPLSLKGFHKGLIGHWGQSGAFAFHDPEKDLYFTGTVNQFTGHNTAAMLMSKVIKLV